MEVTLVVMLCFHCEKMVGPPMCPSDEVALPPEGGVTHVEPFLTGYVMIPETVKAES